MNVIIRGPLLSVTGYGVHARQIFSWALDQPNWNIITSIVPWGICTYYIDPEKQDGLIGEVMARSSPVEGPQALSIQVQLPDEWDPGLATINVGVTAGVETDLCSQAWVEACIKMDKVIVPSTFTKNTFVRSGVPEEKIVVVPEAHSYTPEVSIELDKKLSSLPTKFNLLLFGQITGNNPENDRKNTFYTLKWLVEMFKDDPDVGIIVKTNMGRFTTVDRLTTHGMFKRLVSEIRPGPYPKLYLAHGMLDEVEIGTLYKNRNVKALLAPTRGEGWGLPILDAAASGLPIIATNYSGHLDFLKYVKFLSIDYDMVQVHESRIDGRVFISEAKWANPKEDSFKSRLTKFRKAPDLPAEWAQKGAPILRDTFSLEAIKRCYDTAISDLFLCKTPGV